MFWNSRGQTAPSGHESSSAARLFTRVVGDNVENDVDSMIVGSLHEITQFRACPKMRVDIKKILDTVAVIAGFEWDLAKDGTHPQRSYAKALEVT